MTVAFSTSSPQASVALFDAQGRLLASGVEHAPTNASGACLRLLERLLTEAHAGLEHATRFAADLGPGSFTGVKVGVTLAKALALVSRTQVVGAPSFDLIDPEATVVLPSKRGEWFVRIPGSPPHRTSALPAVPHVGFGPGLEPQRFPSAAAFGPLLGALTPTDAERLLPNYLVEPAISAPNRPFAPRASE